MKLPEPPPTKLPDPTKLFSKLRDPAALVSVSAPELNGEYVHWDELRHREPPHGLAHDEWWFLIQIARRGLLREFPLRDKQHRRFRFGMPDSVLRLVHAIDRDASGKLELPEDITNKATRDQYVVSSLIEEAITSSQLEGASTTRRVAKAMLESGRSPRSHDERMIWNNFQAMEWVRRNVRQPFSRDAILELHRVVTLEALDGGGDGAGRFRRDDETVMVVDHDNGETLHVPPPAASLPDRVDLMCAFANGVQDVGFVHPVVRATLLHFWLAYDHPFVDGNGRTARILFYWSMLQQGFWLTEFLSISRIIKKARVQYARAFLFAEDADADATYFVIHQLRVVRQAIDDLFKYLSHKTRELRDLETHLRDRDDLTQRQMTILARALRRPDERWTIQRHQRTTGVVYQTARQDLLDLASKGFLTQRKVGRALVFTVPADLEKRLGRR